jgi:hypothetical protein
MVEQMAHVVLSKMTLTSSGVTESAILISVVHTFVLGLDAHVTILHLLVDS